MYIHFSLVRVKEWEEKEKVKYKRRYIVVYQLRKGNKREKKINPIFNYTTTYLGLFLSKFLLNILPLQYSIYGFSLQWIKYIACYKYLCLLNHFYDLVLLYKILEINNHK